MKLLDRLIRDRNGEVVIWQTPNLPLWIWIIATALGFSLSRSIKQFIGSIGTLGLAVWAVMEIGWGRSLIRRLAGLLVLLGIIKRFL
jgi:hypothetical protein